MMSLSRFMSTAASLETVKFGVKVTAEAGMHENMVKVNIAVISAAAFLKNFIFVITPPDCGVCSFHVKWYTNIIITDICPEWKGFFIFCTIFTMCTQFFALYMEKLDD